MDEIAARLIGLNDRELPVLTVVLILCGAILAAMFAAPHGRLRRVPFLLAWAACGFGLAALVQAWSRAGQDVAGGFVLPLVVALCLGIAITGGLLWRAAAARARDIGAGPALGWLIFVPLANFYLILRPGEAREEEASPRRARDLVLIVVALALLAGAALMPRIELGPEGPVVASPDPAPTLDLVAARFTAEVEATRPALPVRVDDITLLSGIAAEGARLTLTYDLAEWLDPGGPAFAAMLAADNCRADVFGAQFADGATIDFVYRNPDGTELETLRLTQADCAALPQQ